MRTQLTLALCLLGLTSPAAAQIRRFEGPSPNLTTVLDFDTPFVASGPISSTSAVFTSVGVTSVSLIGAGFSVAGDLITAASNGAGQSLVAANGVLAIAGVGEALDNMGAGDGYDIQLANPVDEFQALFVDQLNMTYNVELYLGATSLGIGNFAYLNPTFPFPAHYWRATGSQFDRIRITFPAGVAGVGIDEFAFGTGPAPAPPVNDNCSPSPLIQLGTTAFDNSTASLSAPLWSCLTDVGADVWFRYLESFSQNLEFSTCGSSFDTTIEVFTGSCAALTSIGCNDDSCATQSSVVINNTVPGTIYYIRVGGWRSDTGPGTLTIAPFMPPQNCALTTFANNNGGNPGGAVYFDLTLTQNVTITGLNMNTSAAVGAPVGLTMYTAPTTSVGNEANMAAWTQVGVDDGNSLAVGAGSPTPITFAAPVVLTAGSYGIALIGSNALTGVMQAHAYTNGTGTNQMAVSPDGVLAMTLGTASNAPFLAPTFTPRVWNGQLCYSMGGGLGTNYCGPAVVNSSGNSGTMGATGTGTVANNNLVLQASGLSLNAFGFFLTSRTAGLVMNPGGSQGHLCLGNPIGRYVGAGQIQNSGATGMISLAVNLTQTPQPTGLVSVVPGETWRFQAWFRDAIGGTATSNFTDGYAIVFN